MHPANLYAAGEPDFAALAAAHPALAQHLIYPGPAAGSSCSNAAAAGSSGSSARPAIDFTSWEATKDLTAALLKVDFGVTWGLPKGQLVPPVPNRANYIHWIADLLQLSSPAGAASGPQRRGVSVGLVHSLRHC
jgi:23S rRNA (adenine1618-N6)-methyltransferase